MDKKIISVKKWLFLYIAIHFFAIVSYLIFLQLTDYVYKDYKELIYTFQNIIYGIAIYSVYRQWNINPIKVWLFLKKKKSNILKKGLLYSFYYLLIVVTIIAFISGVILFLLKYRIITEEHINAFFKNRSESDNSVNYVRKLWETKSFFRFFLYFINTCMFSPLVEEIFFRRFLYLTIRTKTNVFWGVLISSAIFGIGHPSHIIVSTILGAYLSLIYEREKMILINIFVHGFINFIYIISRIWLV